MRTKHLSVLIHIIIKDEVDAVPWNEISNNVVSATSKCLDQLAHVRAD